MPESLSCENRNGVGMARKTSDNGRREESRGLGEEDNHHCLSSVVVSICGTTAASILSQHLSAMPLSSVTVSTSSAITASVLLWCLLAAVSMFL